MIYRTWFCLNKYCKHEFTIADADHPPCPRCHGVKVKWIPRTTGIISGKTRAVDNTVNDLRKIYGDKNYNSPRMGVRAEPRHNPELIPGRTTKFAAPNAMGWATDIPIDPRTGVMPGSYCGTTGVTAKVSATVGSGASRVPVDKRSVTKTGAIPRYEAVHRGTPR